MKKINKLLGLFSLVIIFSVVLFNNKAYAAANNNSTMDEVKEILDEYLSMQHPDVIFGTDEYNKYLVNQLSEGSDGNLSKHPDVGLILDYASIYLYELEEKKSTTSLFISSENTNYESFKDKTIGQLIDEIAAENAKNMRVPRGTVIEPAKKYSVSKATAYAKKWANSYNTNYAKQSSDCTNFVSQILEAGQMYGVLPQHDLPSGMNDNTSYWYYISNKQLSTSFIRVADFYSFYSSRVSKSDTASRATAVKTVKEGDVVLLKRASTGARYHAIYISKKSGSKAYYCGHTSARKDYDFDNINDSDNDYTILKFNSYSNN